MSNEWQSTGVVSITGLPSKVHALLSDLSFPPNCSMPRRRNLQLDRLGRPELELVLDAWRRDVGASAHLEHDLNRGRYQLGLAPRDGRAARFTKLERKPLFEAER